MLLFEHVRLDLIFWASGASNPSLDEVGLTPAWMDIHDAALLPLRGCLYGQPEKPKRRTFTPHRRAEVCELRWESRGYTRDIVT